jgi:hypothetical protein
VACSTTDLGSNHGLGQWSFARICTCIDFGIFTSIDSGNCFGVSARITTAVPTSTAVG